MAYTARYNGELLVAQQCRCASKLLHRVCPPAGDGHAVDGRLEQRCEQVGIDPQSETGRRLIYLVQELLGFPRHLSQHWVTHILGTCTEIAVLLQFRETAVCIPHFFRAFGHRESL